MSRPAVVVRSALIGLAGTIGLAGCALIDQTSFGGAPRAPAPAELAAALASHGTDPLLVIRPDDGLPYGDGLRQAIAAAEARDGTVKFRLQALVPAQGDAASQAAALQANAATARAVLDDMGQDGIDPERVTLTAGTDTHLIRREVRLYQG